MRGTTRALVCVMALVFSAPALLHAMTLAPTTQNTLLDIRDGTLVTIEWDGDRVVRMRTRGVEILPVR